MTIELKDTDKKEIPDISGKRISFEKIIIPNQDNKQFILLYEIINSIEGDVSGGKMTCSIDLFKNERILNHPPILIPENYKMYINLQPLSQNINFTGPSFVDYEVFTAESN